MGQLKTGSVHCTMYRSIVILTISLGVAPLVTGESRGPIGPKLCVELCNQKRNCKVAFYDSQNLVCHFEEPKSSSGMEHITQLMARRTVTEQNGVLIHTRNKGPKIVPAITKQPSGHGHALTENELKDNGYRRPSSLPREWLKVYANHQTWSNALARCRADGTSLVKAEKNSFEILDEITDCPAVGRIAFIKYAWVGLRYSQDRGEFVWMDGTPGPHLKRGPCKDQCCGVFKVMTRYLVATYCNSSHPFVCGVDNI